MRTVHLGVYGKGSNWMTMTIIGKGNTAVVEPRTRRSSSVVVELTRRARRLWEKRRLPARHTAELGEEHAFEQLRARGRNCLRFNHGQLVATMTGAKIESRRETVHSLTTDKWW
jgi:hypothetical protein